MERVNGGWWLLWGLLLAARPLTAQEGDLLSRSEVVLQGGGMNYLGDLNDQSIAGEVHAAFGAGVRCRIDKRWSVRLAGAYGSVSASEDWLPARNLSFRSKVYEGAVMAEFDFRPYGLGATDHQWTPYIFGGVAVFHFGPEAEYVDPQGQRQWVPLQPLHTEGQGTTAHQDRRPYPLTQLAMPFGVGVRCRLNKNFSLAAEYGFRKTWTDYLDDVSTTYVGAELLQAEVADGALAATMADRSATPNAIGIKRGDDSLDDWYSYFCVSVGINMNTLFGWMRSKRCRN